jgi:hypothetical protein
MIGSYAGRVIGVLRAVEFNDQSAFLAAKVSDVVTDWDCRRNLNVASWPLGKQAHSRFSAVV